MRLYNKFLELGCVIANISNKNWASETRTFASTIENDTYVVAHFVLKAKMCIILFRTKYVWTRRAPMAPLAILLS